MHSLINILTSNAVREMPIDELSAVTGGGDQAASNSSGTSFGQAANTVGAAATAAAIGISGHGAIVALYAVEGFKSAFKQSAQ